MKKITILLLIFWTLNLNASTTHLPLSINSNITLNDTLFLDTTLTILEGAIVNISPGAHIIATSTNSSILVEDGALFSNGTTDNPIQFYTSKNVESFPGIIFKKPTTPNIPYSKFKHTSISGMISGLNIMGVEGEDLLFSVSNCIFDSCEISSIISLYSSIIVDSCKFTNGAPETLNTNPSYYISSFSSNVSVSNSVFSDSRGGGIRCEMGCLKLANSSFDISGEIAFGANCVYTVQTSDSVSINNCNFTNPSDADTNTWAGALYIFSPYAPVIIQSSNFNNTYSSNYGSVNIEYGNNVVLHDLLFKNNSTKASGGAIILNGIKNAKLSKSSFIQNSANQNGGAVKVEKVDTLQFSNLVFNKNSSLISGGGVYLDQSGALIKECSFVENSSPKGGGLFFSRSSSNLTNSIFNSNRNSIYFDITERIVLENLLITNDSTIAINVNLTTDTLFASNITSSNNYRDLFINSNTKSRFTNSIFWNSEAGLLNDNIIGAYIVFDKCWGDDDGEGNPLFVDEANGDYTLLENSPCIDAGDSNYCVSIVDLNNNDRIFSRNIDIGAYEYGSQSFINSTPNNNYKASFLLRKNKLSFLNINEEVVSLKLFSLLGKVIWIKKISTSENTVLLPKDIAKGSYIISVETATRKINQMYLNR